MKNRGTLNGTLNGTLKNDNLTNNELALLGIFLSDPSISLSDAGDRMGISRRTVSRIVASLQDKGIVERKGSKKQGSWKIVK
ncbi:MAG: helix-turn-helix domain-containing protein [Bacilli bacterium]|nr:helix-turn-helix domain-containing protein [Bacilli bacterium]